MASQDAAPQLAHDERDFCPQGEICTRDVEQRQCRRAVHRRHVARPDRAHNRVQVCSGMRGMRCEEGARPIQVAPADSFPMTTITRSAPASSVDTQLEHRCKYALTLLSVAFHPCPAIFPPAWHAMPASTQTNPVCLYCAPLLADIDSSGALRLT